MSLLVRCPTCSRHVRQSETACPFCAVPVPADLVPVPHGPRRQYLGKGATAAYLASTLAASGCGARTGLPGPPADDTGPDDAAADSFTLDTSAGFDTGFDTAVDTAVDTAPGDAFDEGACCPIYK